MTKKTKKIILLSIVSLVISMGTITVYAKTKSHSKAYREREKQLLKFDGFYKNSDGTVGGEFKLVTGDTVRVAHIDEEGNVFVYNTKETFKKNKKIYLLNSQSIDGYAKRVDDRGEVDERFN